LGGSLSIIGGPSIDISRKYFMPLVAKIKAHAGRSLNSSARLFQPRSPRRGSVYNCRDRPVSDLPRADDTVSELGYLTDIRQVISAGV